MKSLKIKHLLVICKGLTKTMCYGKGKFKYIGLLCGLKSMDLIGIESFSKPKGRISFSTLKSRMLGIVCN